MNQFLEIELISAEGLKVERKPVKRKTFAVVKINQSFRQSKLDEISRDFPIWKDKFEMEMPNNGTVQFIFVEVFYRTSGGDMKNIGCAKIPVTDFIGGFAPPEGHLNFLSYRLRDEYGDKCGIINVSIKVKSNGENVNKYKAYETKSMDYGGCSSQAAAGNDFWRTRTSSSMATTAKFDGRIVTGVPVWCAYQRPS